MMFILIFLMIQQLMKIKVERQFRAILLYELYMNFIGQYTSLTKSIELFLIYIKSLFYMKTQNPALCKQKDFIFSLGLFKQTMVNRCQVANHMANWKHYSSYHVYPQLAIYFSSPFGRYLTFHTLTSVGR